MLTHWVARAWKMLHLAYKDTIINTFRRVGLSLNPNGSKDLELKIKDLPNITVGDYRRDVGQQDDSEETAAIAEAVASYREAEEKEKEKAKDDENWERLQEGNLSDHERHARGITTLVTDFLRPQREPRPA